MNVKLAVNKSGNSLKVYSQSSGNQIGTIFPNEAFIQHGEIMVNGTLGVGIHFLNSSGNVVSGALATTKASCMKPVSDYPYGTRTINGTNFKVYKLRRDVTLYNTNAKASDIVVKAGSLVAAYPDTLGNNKYEWCQLIMYQNSAGTWKSVPSTNRPYFLDFGLKYGSYNSNITMYGSWG